MFTGIASNPTNANITSSAATAVNFEGHFTRLVISPYVSYTLQPYDNICALDVNIEEMLTTVDPKCHEAVLNEISVYPSNFGLGLGQALNKTVDFINGKLELMSDKFFNIIDRLTGSTNPEELQEVSDTFQEIKSCTQATLTFRNKLTSLEKAYKQQEISLNQHYSPQETKKLMLQQRVVAIPADHTSYWRRPEGFGVSTRNIPVCKKEGKAFVESYSDAVYAHNAYETKCDLSINYQKENFKKGTNIKRNNKKGGIKK